MGCRYAKGEESKCCPSLLHLLHTLTAPCPLGLPSHSPPLSWATPDDHHGTQTHKALQTQGGRIKLGAQDEHRHTHTHAHALTYT
eukprot:1159227-Pelagomonas_calceolata.AAC.7